MNNLIDIIDQKVVEAQKQTDDRCRNTLNILARKLDKVQLIDSVEVSTDKDLIYISQCECKDIHDNFINNLKARGFTVYSREPSVFNTIKISENKTIELYHKYS